MNQRRSLRVMVDTLRVDSPLGSWTQAHWSPPPGDELEGLVETIWDFDGTLVCRREQTFPSGLLELVVQLDEPHRPIQPAARGPFAAVCVDGLRTTATIIEGPSNRCRVLGMRLHPLGAFGILGSSLRELTDQCVDLREVVGRAAEELGHRLATARNGLQRVQTAERWIRARMSRGRAVDPIVASALRQIDQDAGIISVTRFDDLNGRSRSRFGAAFRGQVGLTPKRYARVVRFRRALSLLQTGPSLSAVAAASGYYDQAHMTAEFREHAGLTPRAYRNAKRYPGSSNLIAPG